MVRAENIYSGISNFQLDDRSERDYHSLAHLSKFALSGAGAPSRHDEVGVRELLQHLSKEFHARSTWQYVERQLNEAANAQST